MPQTAGVANGAAGTVQGRITMNNSSILNTARGNKEAQEEFKQELPRAQAPGETASYRAAPVAARAAPADAPVTAEPALKPASRSPAGPEQSASQEARQDQSAPAQADRRTTLAVDFPTEGEPLHFKKLKNAATLEVRLESTDPDRRLWHPLALLPFALGLAIVQRRRRK